MELLRPSDVAELEGGVFVHGGTEVVPLIREGLLETERLVDVRGVVPRGIDGNVIGAGTTLAELEVEPAIPEALREACRLAASPQLRNMGSLGGNLLQSTRCWYWRLGYRCRLTAATAAMRRTASIVSTRSSPTTSAPPRIPPTSRRRS